VRGTRNRWFDSGPITDGTICLRNLARIGSNLRPMAYQNPHNFSSSKVKIWAYDLF